MAKYLTISEAQEKLPELPDELIDDLAIVTNNGKFKLCQIQL